MRFDVLTLLPAFFEAARRDYYEGMRGVSERGAWNDWLEYFLLGVALHGRVSDVWFFRLIHIMLAITGAKRRT